MSRKRDRQHVVLKPKVHARVLAALGDETRLSLVARLAGGESCSIAELTQGRRLTRQAVTKHLRVLERAGIVHSERSGREALFKFNPQPVRAANDYLADVARQWEDALGRLKVFVEGG